jgi:hypothetical protein
MDNAISVAEIKMNLGEQAEVHRSKTEVLQFKWNDSRDAVGR